MMQANHTALECMQRSFFFFICKQCCYIDIDFILLVDLSFKVFETVLHNLSFFLFLNSVAIQV